MSDLDMVIYTAFNGVQWTAKWRDAHAFQAAVEFLKARGALVTGVSTDNTSTGRTFVYMENEEQLQELVEFTKSMGQRGKAE